MIRTQRWRHPGPGPGQLSDAHVRGSMHCAERVSDRAVASDNSESEEGKEDGLGGLCRRSRAKRREEREARRLFPETENVRR